MIPRIRPTLETGPARWPDLGELTATSYQRNSCRCFVLAWLLFFLYLNLPTYQTSPDAQDVRPGWLMAVYAVYSIVQLPEQVSLNVLMIVFFALPLLLTNFLLLLLPPLSFTPARRYGVWPAVWLTGLGLLSSAGWFVYHLSHRATHRLHPGYFALLLAMGLLFTGCLLRGQAMRLSHKGAEVSPAP